MFNRLTIIVSGQQIVLTGVILNLIKSTASAGKYVVFYDAAKIPRKLPGVLLPVSKGLAGGGRWRHYDSTTVLVLPGF